MKVMTMPEDRTMELGSCISRVIHQDNTLTNIIIRLTYIAACSDYKPDESDDVDRIDIEAEENSINNCIYYLNWSCSLTEWFTNFGVMIAKLPNLTELTFNGLDPHLSKLDGFWGEISASISLTILNYKNMNLESWEGGEFPPNLRSIIFLQCTIPKNMGHLLHENDQIEEFSLTTLHFNECSLMNTKSMKEIVEFATELAPLTSITSFWFTSCLLDPVQSMCLIRSLREERESSDDV
jgi:hypothetical protein